MSGGIRDAAVIVVAAGASRRLGGATAKPWLELAGRSILERSLDTLSSWEALRELVIVVRDEDRPRAEAAVRAASIPGEVPVRVVAGGAERRDSVRNGLAAIGTAAAIVLVHDAARPLASLDLFRSVANVARRAGAAIPAVPVADTLRRERDDGSLEIVPRERLHSVQTPQGFERRLLERAHAAAPPAAAATDDAALVEALGRPVALVRGEPGNVKITFAADLALARLLLEDRDPVHALRIGLGHDLHRLEPGGALRLGGVEVGGGVHASGHSDGDVVLHALTDAVLGAAALGDIGQHFPDDASENRGRDSAEFLRRAVELARERGYSPAQADTVIHLERPRLAPHRDAIRTRVALVLGVPADAVSIKAKTAEGLGAVGEGRAVACDAVVTLAPLAPDRGRARSRNDPVGGAKD